jgi:hypothetical protein
MPELQVSLAGKIPAERTLLCMWTVIGHVNEGDRLLLPGLRALHEEPSPRWIFLRPALDNFFYFFDLFLRIIEPDPVPELSVYGSCPTLVTWNTEGSPKPVWWGQSTSENLVSFRDRSGLQLISDRWKGAQFLLRLKKPLEKVGDIRENLKSITGIQPPS